MKFFANITPEIQLPRTFRHIEVVKGDVLYIPGGTIFCEKAVATHNTMIRAASTLATRECLNSISMLTHASGVNLGPAWLGFA